MQGASGEPRDPPRALPLPEEAERILPAALNALNWQTLLRRKEGWSWSERAQGLRCPNGAVAPLNSVKLPSSGATGQLRFVAPLPACRGCELRDGCTDSRAPDYRKELCVTVPGSAAQRIGALLAATRGHAQRPRRKRRKSISTGTSLERPPRTMVEDWERPSNDRAVGPLALDAAILLPAALRRAFSATCRDAEVHVQVGPSPRAPARVPVFATTAAERQHRRRSRAERLRYNALPTGTPVRIRFAMPEAARNMIATARNDGHPRANRLKSKAS